MKAVVLAAGLGTRLRPLTFLVPKALATVGTKPLVDYVIEWLRLNGVREIAVVGYYMQDVLERYLAQFHPDVVFLRSRKLLGTAGQLYYARDWVDGDAAVVNTDVLTNLDLRAPAELHRSRQALLTVVGQIHRVSLRFGVLEVEGGMLRSWREKPTLEYITSTGIYIVSEGVVKRLGEEYLDMDALARSLIPRVAVYVAKEAFFYDVGTIEDLSKAQEVKLDGLKP
ncbi:nucleotidyltransferase family protein [Pyrobaculum neutrophilum]|uniref:Nucleotidyl transferase n=1 Tax=Pyrobaculum neutrophilum (strain DSM 2338 / JCM 9278 / NBRC 100436 / V24Sta) TaxID=444157 RepID=B1YA56_PYRNV|nr:NDP-sugar synthase [Pyrobaculum neutrophilum]ACB39030.1 Nucleotidyl transferase [Pyrobaculum neutrophilum V24Sta]